jgi:hypothetical protein
LICAIKNKVEANRLESSGLSPPPRRQLVGLFRLAAGAPPKLTAHGVPALAGQTQLPPESLNFVERLNDCLLNSNSGSGLQVTGNNRRVERCHAADNGVYGFQIQGAANLPKCFTDDAHFV